MGRGAGAVGRNVEGRSSTPQHCQVELHHMEGYSRGAELGKHTSSAAGTAAAALIITPHSYTHVRTPYYDALPQPLSFIITNSLHTPYPQTYVRALRCTFMDRCATQRRQKARKAAQLWNRGHGVWLHGTWVWVTGGFGSGSNVSDGQCHQALLPCSYTCIQHAMEMFALSWMSACDSSANRPVTCFCPAHPVPHRLHDEHDGDDAAQ